MANVNKPEKKRWSWKTFGARFLVISILLHLTFLGGATYLVVQHFTAKRVLTFKPGPAAPPAPQTVEHKVHMQKDQAESAPQMAKRITTTGMGKITLPEMPEMPTQNDNVKPMKISSPNNNFGSGTSMFGGGGGGGGGGGIPLPSIMADRCSPEGRAKSIAQNGGDPRDDEAILKALRWLKQHQNPDGTWGGKYKGGMTGLALLSFLGHCERPTSGEFAPNVKNGLDAIINVAAADGGNLSYKDRASSMVYQHAISTYALGEAYIITKDERMVPVLKQAVAIILKGQNPGRRIGPTISPLPNQNTAPTAIPR